MLATRVAGGYGLKRPSANQVPDRNTDARGQLKPRHDVTPIAKFAELLVLGLLGFLAWCYRSSGRVTRIRRQTSSNI